MTLKAIVDDINTIDEKYRDLYVEKDGKWELQVSIEGVDGVRTFTDLKKLNEALAKERKDHRELKNKYRPLGDKDPNKILDDLDELEELRAGQGDGKDSSKIDELVEAKLQRKVAPIQRELDAAKQQNQELTEKVTGYETTIRNGKIESVIRAAAGELKLRPEAIEDALMLGLANFEQTEDGSIVVKQDSKFTNGIDAKGWLTDMQTHRPHWWEESVSGGSKGNMGGGAGVSNPWTKDAWNMTKQGEIFKESPERAKKLAEAAGTFIGGPRPK